MTVYAAWLICYYIIKTVFILIRLIMNGTIRVLNSGMCTGGTTLIAHSGFHPVFLKGVVWGDWWLGLRTDSRYN